ncbi:Maleylacetoacetate isomerase, partial [Stegodyphus mimosarum]
MAQSKPVLYSYFRSSCSWRVRIALHLKGIDYEYKAVNLLKDEHLTEDFLKLNPVGEVPVLYHEGKAISQSVAIIEYLEEVVPNHPLLPKDPAVRAAVRAVVNTIVAGIQPLQNRKVLVHLGDATKANAWAKHWIEQGFKAVERILQSTHGQYCFGDVITLADVCLVPQVYNANRFNVDMSQFPLISAISSRLNDLKEFKDTHPSRQPDCPEEL